MLKKHGFTPVFKESPGGHTWINWRNYLNEFVPQLFQWPALSFVEGLECRQTTESHRRPIASRIGPALRPCGCRYPTSPDR